MNPELKYGLQLIKPWKKELALQRYFNMNIWHQPAMKNARQPDCLPSNAGNHLVVDET
jgi:hypothetical protein